VGILSFYLIKKKMLPIPKELKLLFDFLQFLETQYNKDEQKVLFLIFALLLGAIAISVISESSSRLGFFNTRLKNRKDLNIHEQHLVSAKFPLEKIPKEYICPISLSIMVNPVILVPVKQVTKDPVTKMSFDKASIDALLDKAKERGDKYTCPTTRIEFSGYLLNGSLRETIDKWVSRKVAKSTTQEPEPVNLQA
jgi:hypothetical protein